MPVSSGPPRLIRSLPADARQDVRLPRLQDTSPIGRTLQFTHLRLLRKPVCSQFCKRENAPFSHLGEKVSAKLTDEQPCLGCHGFDPWASSGEDEVGGLDELSHDGDDCDLGLLALGDEAVGEGSELWIALPGGQSGQVEQAPWSSAAADDEAGALELGGVAVERGDAGERGGLTSVHGTELRHADDVAGGDDRPEAGKGEQQPEAGEQILVRLDALEDVGLQLGLQPLELADHDLDGMGDGLLAYGLQEGLQLSRLVGDLIVGRLKVRQLLQPHVPGRPHRIQLRGGRRDKPGVKLVVLHLPAPQLSEHLDLDRLVHDHLEARRCQGKPQVPLVAARGLHPHPHDALPPEPGDQLAMARRVVGDDDGRLLAVNGRVQLAFADVDASDLHGRLHSFHCAHPCGFGPKSPCNHPGHETSVAAQLILSPRAQGSSAPPPTVRLALLAPGGRPGRPRQDSTASTHKGSRSAIR